MPSLLDCCCVALCVAACTSLTDPGTDRQSSPEPQQSAAGARDLLVQRIDIPAAPTPPVLSQITASHILLTYRGAVSSRASRSEDEARQLANQILAKIRGGADFKKLADQYTDDPTSKGKGGSLGVIDRTGAPPPFTTAAFALEPGEVSDVIQTPFGFHIIRREQ